MKNIFKLTSVFLTIALLVSVLLISGSLVSAEQKNLLENGNFKVLPDVGAAKPYDVEDFGWKDGGIIAGESTFAKGSFTLKNGNSGEKGFYQEIAFDTTKEYTLSLDVTVTSGTLDIRLYNDTGKTKIASVAEYAAGTTGNQKVKFTPGEGAARIYLGGTSTVFTITSAVLTDGSTEETTTATGSETETATEATETVASETATEATVTETATEATETATETATEATVTETATAATETATETATEATVTETATAATETVTETATEASVTATEASATETQPMVLAENVLFEDTVGNTKTVNPSKTDAWFLVVNEVKADIAANGPIDPDKGEYYQITVTGSVDSGEADFHMGEDADWNEYWGQSGKITTEPSTVTATIPVAIPAGLEGKVYLADSGAAGHTLTWTYAKLSVFRLGAATESSATATETATEASVTETEASATETEASATETEASATETEASATETEASATETEASATETEASATETEVEPTGTGADEELLGDANNDGEINMKDVLTLRKYIAGLEVVINEAAADANADGEINMKDVLMLRKFIAGLVEKLGA